MAEAPARIEPLTLAEFIRLYEQAGPFEVVEGERIALSPTKFRHSDIALTLLMALNNHALPKGLGRAYMETTFIKPDVVNPDWVKGLRVPDVMFIQAERLVAYKATMPDWENQPLALIPDLVIEIVSPTDSYSDIDRKVEGCLRDGVQMVWVMDPDHRKVSVYQAKGNQQIRLYEGDTLTGGEVLPGFEIAVSKIFE